MIHIRLLGGFHVDVDGRAVDSVVAKSPRGILLMQYLLLQRGAQIPVQQLMTVMWPGGSSASPESALKTLVNRLRALLGQISPVLAGCVTTVRGGYCWASAAGVTVDLDVFEGLAAYLKDKSELSTEVRLSFRHALDVYAGDLLGGLDQQPWMSDRAEEVRLAYIALVEKYVSLLEQDGEYLEIISACRSALQSQPLNEPLRLHLARALSQTRHNTNALRQYGQAVQLSYATTPEERSELVRQHYVQALAREASLNESIEALHAELTGDVNTVGALVCSETLFQEVYQLQKRCLERVGADILLGVILITGLDDKPMELEQAMTDLFAVLKTSLRRGDAITRLHIAQAAILLPMATEASGQLVLDRIKRSFYQTHPDTQCQLTHRFTLLHTGSAQPRQSRR